MCQCSAVNDKNAKVCSECGFRFGEIARVKNGNKTSLLTTCPGCGSVYQVQRSKGFIITMAVLAVVFSFLFIPSIIFAVLAILHAAGKLQGRMIKRCTVCHKTPSEVKKDLHQTAETKKQIEIIHKTLQNRKETPIVRVFAIVNKWIEDHITTKNIFPYFTLFSFVFFAITIIQRTKLTVSGYDLIKQSATVPYLATTYTLFFVLIIEALFIATLITNLKENARARGIGLILGVITAISEFALVSINRSLRYFEYEISHYEIEVRVDSGNVNAFLIIGAIILLVGVVAAFFIEREKQYLELQKQASEIQ